VDFLKVLALTLLTLPCAGCQLGYYLHTAYHQEKLLGTRVPIERALKSDKLNEAQKAKLRLVQEAKAFAEGPLGLKKSDNYTSFVQLDEPYVTYVVQAAYIYELKPYLWHFPFVGDVPYKGYFVKSMAEEEAASFDPKRYDTYVRGVSAYSTLGWFQDSVLSSMLRYEDADLVETIIHETIHTTLYIKSAADFNERLATFMGHEGMRLFYLSKEGEKSPHLKEAEEEAFDEKLFSQFLTRELESLKTWYEKNHGRVTPELKQARLKEIQVRFTEEVRPKMKRKGYLDFEKRELNNAYLLAYRTYEYSLDDFAKLYDKMGHDFHKTIEWMKGLEKAKDPEAALKQGGL
jgi:predicted aminopeptidase